MRNRKGREERDVRVSVNDTLTPSTLLNVNSRGASNPGISSMDVRLRAYYFKERK